VGSGGPPGGGWGPGEGSAQNERRGGWWAAGKRRWWAGVAVANDGATRTRAGECARREGDAARERRTAPAASEVPARRSAEGDIAPRRARGAEGRERRRDEARREEFALLSGVKV